MRYVITSILVALSVAWGIPPQSQLPDWVRQVLVAAQLPVVTTSARQEGATSGEIRAMLEAMRTAGVPAYQATALIDTARVARREYGPVENFGAFVQAQLAAGKRGQELAAAIRAEHARQGKSNPARAGKSRPPRAHETPGKKQPRETASA